MHVLDPDCRWLGGMGEISIPMFIQASSLPPSQGNTVSRLAYCQCLVHRSQWLPCAQS